MASTFTQNGLCSPLIFFRDVRYGQVIGNEPTWDRNTAHIQQVDKVGEFTLINITKQQFI
jgi:hypothetical protein